MPRTVAFVSDVSSASSSRKKQGKRSTKEKEKSVEKQKEKSRSETTKEREKQREKSHESHHRGRESHEGDRRGVAQEPDRDRSRHYRHEHSCDEDCHKTKDLYQERSHRSWETDDGTTE